MQENRKIVIKNFILIMVFTLFLAVFSISTQAKKGYFLEIPGCACRDDNTNDIYYAYEMGGLRMGITKYNPNTMEKKVIFSGGNKIGNGFYNLTIKGDYIYFIWDRALGTAEFDCYLYRIKKNGKGIKSLAKADNYVIKGNKIYYFVAGLNIEGEIIDKRKTNIVRKMNLDGINKKKVKQLTESCILALYDEEVLVYSGNQYYSLTGKKINIAENTSYKGTIYRDYDNRGNSAMINGYKYYLNKDGNTLYRKNRDNQVNKVILIKKNTEGGYIWDFTICGNYVLVRCSGENLIRVYDGYDYYDAMAGAIYSVRIDGKEKHKLKEWALAE